MSMRYPISKTGLWSFKGLVVFSDGRKLLKWEKISGS